MIDGREHLIGFVNEFQMNRVDCRMSEILFCEGCINGPMIKEVGGLFERRKKVADYVRIAQHGFNFEEWQYT